MIGNGPDLLRLLAVPIFAWAAWSDYQTRRVDARAWPIVFAIGGTAAVWQITQIAPLYTSYEVNRVIQIVAVPPIAGLVGAILYNGNALGGADAKALFTLGLLFPVTPEYTIPGLKMSLPLFDNSTGVLAAAVVMNGLVFGVFYPFRMWLQNLARGERTLDLFTSTQMSITDLSNQAGQIECESPKGETILLDADTLRMYLRWRDISLEALAENGAEFRSAGSIGETYEINTGAIEPASGTLQEVLLPDDVHLKERQTIGADGGVSDDSWGAKRFLEEIDHHAYGTEADDLRAALDHLTDVSEVRVQPAFPLIVPMFFGLLSALIIGDFAVAWREVVLGI